MFSPVNRGWERKVEFFSSRNFWDFGDVHSIVHCCEFFNCEVGELVKSDGESTFFSVVVVDESSVLLKNRESVD